MQFSRGHLGRKMRDSTPFSVTANSFWLLKQLQMVGGDIKEGPKGGFLSEMHTPLLASFQWKWTAALHRKQLETILVSNLLLGIQFFHQCESTSRISIEH